jgi:hypothetical protein
MQPLSKQYRANSVQRESVGPREEQFSGESNASELSTPLFFSESEARLADIWHDVLGIRPASRNDHFFELGGYLLNKSWGEGMPPTPMPVVVAPKESVAE